MSDITRSSEEDQHYYDLFNLGLRNNKFCTIKTIQERQTILTEINSKLNTSLDISAYEVILKCSFNCCLKSLDYKYESTFKTFLVSTTIINDGITIISKITIYILLTDKEYKSLTDDDEKDFVFDMEIQ